MGIVAADIGSYSWAYSRRRRRVVDDGTRSTRGANEHAGTSDRSNVSKSSGARLSRVESSLSRPSTSEPWKMGIACTQESRRRTEGKVARGATYQGPEAGQGGAVRWPAHRPIEWRSSARSRPELAAVIDLRNRASGSAGAHTGRRRCVLRWGATEHLPRRGHSRGSSGAGPRCESAAGRRECAELQARGGHDLEYDGPGEKDWASTTQLYAAFILFKYTNGLNTDDPI